MNMIKKDTFDFLDALRKNNNREWFAENKEWYNKVRMDFEEVVKMLIDKIAEFDPQIKYLAPKDCIFRIYRDTRFSLDKTPYKTHLGAVLRPEGLSKSSGYYLHVSAEESFISCGHYALEPDKIKKIRTAIYNDYDNFRKIVEDVATKTGVGDLARDTDMLKRVPQGFDKNHPSAEYLKLKNFYVLKNIDRKVMMKENFVDEIVKVYHLFSPLNNYLNSILEND